MKRITLTMKEIFKKLNDSMMGSLMGRFGGSTILGGVLETTKKVSIEFSIDILERVLRVNEVNDYIEDEGWDALERAKEALNDLYEFKKEIDNQ